MIIKNGLVFNAEGRFEEKEVYVEDEKISKTGEGEIIDATGLSVIPGLTDIHFHACVGYLHRHFHFLNMFPSLVSQFVS